MHVMIMVLGGVRDFFAVRCVDGEDGHRLDDDPGNSIEASVDIGIMFYAAMSAGEYGSHARAIVVHSHANVIVQCQVFSRWSLRNSRPRVPAERGSDGVWGARQLRSTKQAPRCDVLRTARQLMSARVLQVELLNYVRTCLRYVA